MTQVFERMTLVEATWRMLSTMVLLALPYGFSTSFHMQARAFMRCCQLYEAHHLKNDKESMTIRSLAALTCFAPLFLC